MIGEREKARYSSVARGQGSQCASDSEKKCQKEGKRSGIRGNYLEKREKLGKIGKTGKKGKISGRFFNSAPPYREDWLRHWHDRTDDCLMKY